MTTKLEDLEAALEAFVKDTSVSASNRYDQLEDFNLTVQDHLTALDRKATDEDGGGDEEEADDDDPDFEEDED